MVLLASGEPWEVSSELRREPQVVEYSQGRTSCHAFWGNTPPHPPLIVCENQTLTHNGS